MTTTFLGCGEPPADADARADADAGEVDGGRPSPLPWLAEGMPPLQITPCPDGWSETTSESGVTTCDPFGGEQQDCPDGFAHFTGETGCVPVGAACPDGDFATDLPTDRPIVYIRPGSTGGDGSAARPYPDLGSAGAVPRNTVVALSRGRHVGRALLGGGLTLWGACAAETVLTATSGTDAVIGIDGPAEVRNLTVGPAPGVGIFVAGTAALGQLDGVVIAGVTGGGLVATRSGRLIAHEVVVRDTQPIGDELGWGLEVRDRAHVDLDRMRVVRSRDLGFGVFGLGTRVTAVNLVVSDTLPNSSGMFGRAFDVEDGALVEVRSAVLETSREVAVFASDVDTNLLLEDTIIRDTRPQENDDEFGRGLSAQDAATVTLRRVVVEESHDAGLRFTTGAAGELEDVVVRRTHPQVVQGFGGNGLRVGIAGSVVANRVVVEQSVGAGVDVYDEGSTLTMSDAVVRDTESREINGLRGTGMTVEYGATADLTRLLFDRNREVGVIALNPNSRITMTDSVVRATRERARDGSSGYGIAVTDSASFELTRFALDSNLVCGALVDDDGQLDLLDGEVFGSEIGACVQVPGYDLARLEGDVVYHHNGANLDVTTLPVPDAERPEL